MTVGYQLQSAAGLTAQINANGSLRRFDHGNVSLLLFPGTEVDAGPANIYLRRRSPNSDWIPLLGPESPTRFSQGAPGGALLGLGTWRGIEYQLRLVLTATSPTWFWHVAVLNKGRAPCSIDLTYAQDLALAPYGAVRMNEFYVSQYIDHAPFSHPSRGWILASRQNQAADGRHPWCLTGSLRKAVGFETDALPFYGFSRRSDAALPGMLRNLSNKRLQHEHSMVVIRDRSISLKPGQTANAGFFGHFVADHPTASSAKDKAYVNRILAMTEAAAPEWSSNAAARDTAIDPGTVFSAASPLPVRDLTLKELRQRFEGPWRHLETDPAGKRLSFFCAPDRHVVLRTKEAQVLRPHGHLLRTGLHLTPDESSLTSTVWMNGVFHSMVTQGHVSINRFLSTFRSYLGLYRAQGLRVFVEVGREWRLLDAPSAFEMSPRSCRWIYRHRGGDIEVRAGIADNPQLLLLDIDVVKGLDARFLICCHIALDGDDGMRQAPASWTKSGERIEIRAPKDSDVGRRFPNGFFQIQALPGTHWESVGGDELLFKDGRSRNQPYLCLISSRTSGMGLMILGDLVDEGEQRPLKVLNPAELSAPLSLASAVPKREWEPVSRLADIVPWFSHNALVHYLSPRGLEQFSGGGWGTRDVCQGPVECLLALGQTEPIRDLLLRVFRTQNPDGDWPQWFMFFERERGIRPDDSHGDIVFWPLVVLAQYLLLTEDAGVLEERVPFFDARGPDAGELATVWMHAQRALALIERRVIPGTALAAYGHGDWNDSLQPADPALRERMCSAWTVTLNVQMLTGLARALRSIGRDPDAEPLEARATRIRADFQRRLVIDGILTGYAIFNGKSAPRYLLHPRDRSTGIHYSSLAMVHAILEDLLTPQQVRDHLRLIQRHLHGPDGLRLFNRPMSYQGGVQQLFQRAETATFFGREIGLMYMHAHLRYAQALAHLGHADAFFQALCQANPVAIDTLVSSAVRRQANCYYSSSDAAFADRYEARRQYSRVNTGRVRLEGGWRVYSSGAGIAVGLIFRHFLGFRREAQDMLIDPVVPASLNGLTVRIGLLGRPVEIEYRVGKSGRGVTAIQMNEQPLSFARDANPHRPGAARVDAREIARRLTDTRARLVIDVG